MYYQFYPSAVDTDVAFMQQMDPVGFFQVLMETVEVPVEKYQLGRTKLFMKAGAGKAPVGVSRP